ncbi:hypothetical protein [Bacillus cereus]
MSKKGFLFTNRYFTLSMELVEFSEAGIYKRNTIHKRFKR